MTNIQIILSAVCALVFIAVGYLAFRKGNSQGRVPQRQGPATVYVPRLFHPLEALPQTGCGLALPPPLQLSLSEELPQEAASYNTTQVYCNGQLMYDEMTARLVGRKRSLYVQTVERWARSQPGLDWRIVIQDALRQLVYQRHGAGQWRLVHVGAGIFG